MWPRPGSLAVAPLTVPAHAATVGGVARRRVLGSGRGRGVVARHASPHVRHRRRFRRARRVLWWINGTLTVAIPFTLFAVLVVGPRFVPYQNLTVLSASMRPALAPGDLVVTTPVASSSIGVGDVLTYRIPVEDRRVVTHRVVEIVEPGPHPVVRTQGDASATPDPWLARLDDDVAWRMRARIPYLGWGVNALRGPELRWFATTVAPVLLAGAALIELWPRRWRPRRLPTLRPAVAAATVMGVVGIGTAGVAFAAWSDPDSATATYSTATLAPPTNPAAEAGTCTLIVGDDIVVTWTASASTWADGYEILRSTTSGGPYSVVGTVAGQATATYTDGPLPFSTTYHYVVRATKAAWRSVETAQVSRTTRTALCL